VLSKTGLWSGRRWWLACLYGSGLRLDRALRLRVHDP